jgi:hypothetical protein
MENEEGNSTTQSPPPDMENTEVETPEIKAPEIEEPSLETEEKQSETESTLLDENQEKEEEPIDLDKISPPSSIKSSSSKTKKKRKRSNSKGSSKKSPFEKKVGKTLKKLQSELRALSRTVKNMKSKMPVCGRKM